MDQRVLICASGRPDANGIDRLGRCLRLAAHLQQVRGAIVVFFSHQDLCDTGPVRTAGLPTLEAAEANFDAAFVSALSAFRPDAVVFDVPRIEASLLDACRKEGIISIALDSASASNADIAIDAILESADAYYRGPMYAIVHVPKRQTVHGEAATSVLLRGAVPAEVWSEILDCIGSVKAVREVSLEVPEPLVPAGEIMERVRYIGPPSTEGLAAEPSSAAVVVDSTDFYDLLGSGIPVVLLSKSEAVAEVGERLEQSGTLRHFRADARGLDPEFAGLVESVLAEPERARLISAGTRAVDGRGIERVAELVSCIRLLEWDTSFFGRTIATLAPERLSESIVHYAMQRCRAWGVDCLYYLCDCHHSESVRLAEKYGFHFVDIRTTFERDLKRRARVPMRRPEGISIRSHRSDDVASLKQMTRTAYLDSRYYFDRNFPRERCEAFYVEWIEKSCFGFVDQVLVAEVEGRPAGFVTCRMLSSVSGAIELVGVDEKQRGKGVARVTIEAALDWFAERDVEQVTVATQGRNYAAQRLYQQCGFLTSSLQLWYHKWFTTPAEEVNR